MKIAAIDIGSNSIKLAVVEAATSDSFAVLAREKETVRPGHNTLRERHLSPAGIFIPNKHWFPVSRPATVS